MSVVKITKEANDVWNDQYGNDCDEAVDFAGKKIFKSAFRDFNSRYGWDIDHIWPQSLGGSNEKFNKQDSEN